MARPEKRETEKRRLARPLSVAIEVVALLAAIALAAAVGARAAAAAPSPPYKPPPPPSGTLAVCNASGSRPITSSLTFALVAPPGAGGSQTFSVAVGSCTPPVFYPVGTVVTVTETVPSGYAVTSIAIGGGASTISSNSPAGGTAAVTIGTGASLLTFTTSGPPLPCKVPRVLGLALASAKAAIARNGCAVGHVTRAYSRSVRSGRVISQKPRAGLVLAHAAPVDVVVSRGSRR